VGELAAEQVGSRLGVVDDLDTAAELDSRVVAGRNAVLVATASKKGTATHLTVISRALA